MGQGKAPGREHGRASEHRHGEASRAGDARGEPQAHERCGDQATATQQDDQGQHSLRWGSRLAPHSDSHPAHYQCPTRKLSPDHPPKGEDTRALVEQTTVVDPQRLGRSIGRLDASEIRAVDSALALVLGL
ncbi:MAG: type II toxin-antitoxin system PemK/MazF family toxin [Actinobacteria bacterium]|nr:MAG: type II toxin-antitoxin system PemK/MazF family toxin [Actinomycetota bacterium]